MLIMSFRLSELSHYAYLGEISEMCWCILSHKCQCNVVVLTKVDEANVDTSSSVESSNDGLEH